MITFKHLPSNQMTIMWTLLYAILGAPSMAIKKAHYAVIKSDPPYEIRVYEPSIITAVMVAGESSDSVNAGFKKLAGYMFWG